MIDRRFVLRALAAAMPAMSLTGCDLIQRFFASACPENPEESGGVDWVPSVLHPVFYGFQDLMTADGAPGPVRTWYPTYDGTALDAPMLKVCAVRWPVVRLIVVREVAGLRLLPVKKERGSHYRLFLARSGLVDRAAARRDSPRGRASGRRVAVDADRMGAHELGPRAVVDQRPEANAIVGPMCRAATLRIPSSVVSITSAPPASAHATWSASHERRPSSRNSSC